MTLTRTEDKLDKNITRLLMQSPLGLTIGDITAAAKCTPQTARKSLARIGAEKDASGMLYVLRDDDAQQPEQDAHAEPEAATVPEQTAPKPSEVLTENWGGIPFLNPFADAHAPEPTDPAPVAEAPAAQPEQAPANVAGPLTDLQQQIKDHINSLSEAQIQAQQVLQDFRDDCMEAADAEALNALVKRLDRSHPAYVEMRQALMTTAARLPVSLDKAAGLYVDNMAPATEEAP